MKGASSSWWLHAPWRHAPSASGPETDRLIRIARRPGIVRRPEDEHSSGAELVRRIEGSPTFRSVTPVRNPLELRQAINRAIAALQVAPSFSRDLVAGRPAEVEIVLDGRRSNAAQIVDGYLGQIGNGFLADDAVARRPAAVPRVVTRNWFNANLNCRWFTLPGLIAIIALLIGLW